MNKKIKIIDLLNKIANGEEVPKEIKKKYLEGNSFENLIDNLKYFDKDFSKTLNDEVEILEDNTEEIEELDEEWTYIEGQVEKIWSKSELELLNKINEIIRYIKRKESEDKQ